MAIVASIVTIAYDRASCAYLISVGSSANSTPGDRPERACPRRPATRSLAGSRLSSGRLRRPLGTNVYPQVFPFVRIRIRVRDDQAQWARSVGVRKRA